MREEPKTSLDTRFSDPDATATPWPEVVRLLESAELFWLTTVRADGRPHVTPLVAVWLDDALHFCTGETEQKFLNLQRDAHVTLTTGCNTWDRGTDVVVEGDAVEVSDPVMLEHLAAAWATKWDGRWRFEIGNSRFQQDSGEAVVFAVRPTKVMSFGKGAFSHTSHRF